MKRILKYELTILDGPEKQSVFTKPSAKPISVIEQNGEIMLYCETYIDDEPGDYEQKFLVIGTGWEYKGADISYFIGTVKVGSYVRHVYRAN